MRCFVAIELPEPLRDALGALQAHLPGRLVPEENLHLTLAFLGGVAAPHSVIEELEMLRLPAPVLRATALDVFGGRKPALAFAAFAPEPALVSARDAVRRACRNAGVDLRRERFRPHVTLTRFGRHGPDPRAAAQLAGCLGPVAPGEWRAERFGLYRSELGPGGARYDMVSAHDFA